MLFANNRVIIPSRYMDSNLLRITKITGNTLALVAVIILSGCNTVDTQSSELLNLQHLNQNMREKLEIQITRKNILASREAAISDRETELVNLFSEFSKERKTLEIYKDALELKANQKRDKVRVKSKPATHKITTPKSSKMVLGGLENVYIYPPGIQFNARIDTGAKTSSINAQDIVEFERDGKPYVRFNVIHPKTNKKIEVTRLIRKYVRIKEHDKTTQRRQVVRLRIKLANINEWINFTLADRSNFSQPILVGRNFLRDLAVVDVSKNYIATTKDADYGSK